MKKLVLSLLLAAAAAIAFAQSPPPAASKITLNWTAVTKESNGTAVPTSPAITYNIYQCATATSGCALVLPPYVAGTSSVVTSLAAGPCFAVTAVQQLSSGGTSESAYSNVACVLQPTPPGSFSVTIQLQATSGTTIGTVSATSK